MTNKFQPLDPLSKVVISGSLCNLTRSNIEIGFDFTCASSLRFLSTSKFKVRSSACSSLLNLHTHRVQKVSRYPPTCRKCSWTCKLTSIRKLVLAWNQWQEYHHNCEHGFFIMWCIYPPIPKLLIFFQLPCDLWIKRLPLPIHRG